MKKLSYRDTRNYAPIDVIKGIDLQTKKIVMGDAEAPEGAEMMPKCKFCKNFTETEDYLGICESSRNDPKFMSYGDMYATTCETFEAR
jgi:4-hydroxyphenylacetate decarboxylase small subunit